MINYERENSFIENGIENFLNEDSSLIQIAKGDFGIEIVTLKKDLPLNIVIGAKDLNEGMISLASELADSEISNSLNDSYINLEKVLRSAKLILSRENNREIFNTKLSVLTKNQDVVLYNLYGKSLVGVLNFAESYFSNND